MRETHAAFERSDNNAESRAEAKSQYQQAIDSLRLVESSGKATNALDLRAKYLIGICWLESENLPAAQEQFERVLLASSASEEGVAAAFQTANLLRRQGRNDEALAMYRRLVKAIGDPVVYHNELLPLAEVRRQMLAAYEQFLNKSQIDEAIQLSRVLHPLFPTECELELSGELYRSVANSYSLKAAAAKPEQAKILSAKAR